MDELTKKTITTKRGFTYTYYVSPAKSGKPTLLFSHGFPDHAALWEDLATKHLKPAGYGLVIPDLLGYDGTSKPTDPAAYRWDRMTADLCDILDNEGIDKIISVGHDWGSPMAQKVYNYHPERCIGLIQLNVAYGAGPPAGPFKLDDVRPKITELVGYFPQWYWYFFTNPAEGPPISMAHPGSFFDACHDEPEGWMNTLCAKDGLKNWVLQDKTCKRQPYATEELKQDFVARMQRDGFDAPMCWYRATTEGHQYEVDKDLPADRWVVNVPYLFIGGKRDCVCLARYIESPKKMGLLPNFTYEEVDTGHWCMLSKPREIGEIFLKYLGNTF
ncbi:alpha/beta-hydrolase [Rhizodiscina lignyota]|uniref:Alpha/beta-hydrolase n=1 Tax=Rhizodiscina lignyota TaxID=1504668 RepID=A0A9P4IAW7_9PEZI|nr:alpha/beta-hydrolase [Rhizodiscina lignyota]